MGRSIVSGMSQHVTFGVPSSGNLDPEPLFILLVAPVSLFSPVPLICFSVMLW